MGRFLAFLSGLRRYFGSVRQVAKAILVTAAVVLVPVAIVTLCVNLYVQSAGVQTRIAQGLSDAFHLQVKLANASFTPWGGLHLTGIDVAQPDPANAGSFLQTAEVSAHIRLFSLLRRRLDIRQLSVNDPKVVWFQNAGGSWSLPAAPTPPPPPPGAAVPVPSSAPLPPPQTTATGAEPGGPPGPPPPPPATPFTVSVGRFLLKRASVDFLDAAGKPFVTFTGITVDCPSLTDSQIRGHIRAAKAVIRGVFVLEDISATFTFADGLLRLAGFDASIAEGHIRGACEVQTLAQGSPFSLAAQFENVELQRVIPRRKDAVIEASGLLGGFVKVGGNAQENESIAGSGKVVLRKGHVRYELFQMLGDILQIPDLSELDLSEAHLDYRVAKAKINVDELLLQSPRVEVTAHGNVGFDGRLDLAAKLGIDRRISEKLPSIIRDNFVTSVDGDFAHRDFNIYGSVASPKTDLVQRETGRRIKRQLTDLLFNVFGAHHNEAPQPSPTAPPAPAVSPLPTPMAAPVAPVAPSPVPSPALSPGVSG